MTDEVGPNDTNRGRSSIGGFKMPGSKPIAVRGLDDIHTAGWGGFRKPKAKQEYTQSTPDLAGGGYTPTQTNDERSRLVMYFLGIPVLLLAAVGFLGWLVFGNEPEPITSTCGDSGYSATFNRSDFHREAHTARVSVRFDYNTDTFFTEQADMDLPTGELLAVVIVEAPDLEAVGAVGVENVSACTVMDIELNPRG